MGNVQNLLFIVSFSLFPVYNGLTRLFTIVGIVLRKKQKKRDYLKHTDHRLEIGPAGRNLFISRDKQAQDKSARRIKVWMRVVIGLVILVAAAAALFFIGVYLVPYFHSEFTVSGSPGTSEVSSSLSSGPLESLPLYDENGLPVYGDDLNLFVVNEASPATAEFVPELAEIGGVLVDKRLADALRGLISAAKEDGLALVFTEGYVSYEEQKKRFDSKVEELMNGPDSLTTVMARTEAKMVEPQPGESDFQSGLCIRLQTDDAAKFEDSRTYSWLKSNMGKYGFVFRYPADKEDSTGVKADPSVIRYVGSENAAAMQQRSMCLEEYISYLNSQ